ncbi:hypothetical protein [Natrononativus amylolyticus]|uniref:hypothetical protein n=1 Tax=Natrononativus amylolyticus TaxID=2963434 RepID=UPI0020CC7F35|nr:hypothetical protein [Natrononativus amylolyticus]
MKRNRAIPAGPLAAAVVASLALAVGLRLLAPEWHGGIALGAAALALVVVLVGAHVLGGASSDDDAGA